MVLSDRSIKEELAKGRIVIDPLGEGCIQPASVDVHLDRGSRWAKTMVIIDSSRKSHSWASSFKKTRTDGAVTWPPVGDVGRWIGSV